jgi:subtilisin family serine protease
MFKKILISIFCISFVSFGSNYKKNEVIIKLKDGSVHSLDIKNKISKNTFLVKVPENTTVEEFIKQLKKKNYIQYAEPNYIVRKAETYPDDILFSDQWGLEKIDAPKAWDLTKGSNAIYIAVLDTGADYAHPDLAQNLWVNEDERKGDDNNCYDGQDDDGNGYVDDCYGFNSYNGIGNAFDDDGHGTHVSGIIGAVTNNNQGVAGTSWNVKIIPCKFLDNEGNGDIPSEITCIQYIKDLKVQKGLNIVALNASYGGEYNSNAERDALSDLKNYGILVVSAAGNDGNNNDFKDFSPCNYNLENQVCVGATNQQDKRATFSNYSKTKVHIYAPGESILSTFFDKENNSHIYAYINGTSQATPFVTGGVVLLKSLNPSFDYEKIKKKLMLTGDNILNLSGYSYTCNRLNLYDLISSNSSSPKICLDKISYDFGTISTDEKREQIFVVRSTGEQSLIISQITSDNTNFNIKEDKCSGKIINSLDECSFKVEFSPSNPLSNQKGNITIFSNAKDVKISVKGKINHPPEILSFEAHPDKADVDETITFTWNILDEDFDSLTCKLDFDDDGAIDKIINNCSSGDTASIKYKKDGEYKVSLYVSDGKTEVSESIKVKIGSGSSKTIFGCTFSSKGSSDFSFLFLVLIFLSYRTYQCKKNLHCNKFLQ